MNLYNRIFASLFDNYFITINICVVVDNDSVGVDVYVGDSGNGYSSNSCIDSKRKKPSFHKVGINQIELNRRIQSRTFAINFNKFQRRINFTNVHGQPLEITINVYQTKEERKKNQQNNKYKHCGHQCKLKRLILFFFSNKCILVS